MTSSKLTLIVAVSHFEVYRTCCWCLWESCWLSGREMLIPQPPLCLCLTFSHLFMWNSWGLGLPNNQLRKVGWPGEMETCDREDSLSACLCLCVYVLHAHKNTYTLTETHRRVLTHAHQHTKDSDVSKHSQTCVYTVWAIYFHISIYAVFTWEAALSHKQLNDFYQIHSILSNILLYTNGKLRINRAHSVMAP